MQGLVRRVSSFSSFSVDDNSLQVKRHIRCFVDLRCGLNVLTKDMERRTMADSACLEDMGEGGAKMLRIPLRTILCLGGESIMVSGLSGVLVLACLLAAA